MEKQLAFVRSQQNLKLRKEITPRHEEKGTLGVRLNFFICMMTIIIPLQVQLQVTPSPPKLATG